MIIISHLPFLSLFVEAYEDLEPEEEIMLYEYFEQNSVYIPIELYEVNTHEAVSIPLGRLDNKGFKSYAFRFNSVRRKQ